MFVKGNRLIYLFFYLFIYSCSNNEKLSTYKSDQYVKSNFDNYSNVRKTIIDSLNIYLDSLLKSYLNIYGQEWQIDSLVCINSKGDKLVTTINNSSGVENYAVSDEISKILGKKINNQWYFFPGGGTLIVPRDMYGKDAMHPLSFHELSQIARENMLTSALIKDKAGNYIVNDDWVEKHFYYNGMCGHCKTQAQYDSTHWFKITDKWKHKIDTNQYKPLRKNKNSEVVL